MLRLALNLFWLAFAADGLLSVADEYLSLGTGSSALTIMRGWMALLVLLLSIGMVVLLVATPRLPKRVVVPMLLFLWWVTLASAYPVRRFDVPHLDLWISLLQVVLAGGVWFWGREKNTPAPWPLAVPDGPNFSWRHTLLAGPAMGLLLLVYSVVALFSGLATEIEHRTGGYVKVYPDGVYLVERKFRLQDNEVWLAGMVHVARDDFYSGILPQADPAMPAVVLVEGVTDNKRLLGKGSLKYTNVARLLNITAQDESAFTDKVVAGLQREKHEETPSVKKAAVPAPAEIRFKHADVDVETFHPKTIAFIVAVMALFQSRDFTSVMTALTDPHSPLADAEVQDVALQDILHSRNQRLVSEIEVSMKDYRRIIVPWGALHLPEVESWLLSKNFVQSDETERKAMGFW